MADHVELQREHYSKVADHYVTSRKESLAYSSFLGIWVNRLLQPWIKATDEENRQNQIILDPMCGHGNLAPYLLQYSPQIYLNDLSAEMLEQIDDDIREKVVVIPPSDVADTGIKTESIDVVIISGGLHHVYPNLDNVLKELLRLLKPGGVLLFGEPSNEFFLVRMMRNFVYRHNKNFDAETEHAFRHRELIDALDTAGFESVEVKPFGSIGYLLMAQVGIIPILRKSKNRAFFKLLTNFDRMIESLPLLNRTCFALTGSAWKK